MPPCLTQPPKPVGVTFLTKTRPGKVSQSNVDPGSFTAHVKIPALAIDREVFGEAAMNCKSCRAKITATSLTWSCHGDMAASTGVITVTDSVLTIEHDANSPLSGVPVGMKMPARPPPKVDVYPLPCGSKVTFTSPVPDPDKKPVTSCE